MSGLKNLSIRLNYCGGSSQESRMREDKLRSLKKALLYSYQAETAILEDGREFRCLINKNKLKLDYEDTIISIPFEDICLNKSRVGKTSEGIEPIGLKTGDVFTWKENGSKWLVCLQHLEEDAYFRAEIRKCEGEETLNINGKEYYVYVRGPVETTIPEGQKSNTLWNTMNYTLLMYITKNDETLEYFRRFKEITFDNRKWQVTVVNRYANKYMGNGIIEISLREISNNQFEKVYEENQQQKAELNIQTPVDIADPYISGPGLLKPYDEALYTIYNVDGGVWSLSNKKAKIIDSDATSAIIEITTGRSGNVDLIFTDDDGQIFTYPIVIESL